MTRRLPKEISFSVKQANRARKILLKLQRRLYRRYPRVNHAQEALEVAVIEYRVEDDLNDCINLLGKTGVAYDILRNDVSLNKLDRRKGMFAGPLYTSVDYMWPTCKSGNFAQPVCQIDLRDATRISGKQFGDGLLQVWHCDLDDYVIRVIPRTELELAIITPLLPLSEYKVIEEWPINNDWVNGGLVTQITGYAKPFFDFDDYTIDLCEGLLRLPMAKRDHGVLQSVVTYFRTPRPIHCDHLFGFVDGVQYSASDKPFCLLELCNGKNFGFGEIGGAGHVFFEFDAHGHPRFSFDWSCG